MNKNEFFRVGTRVFWKTKIPNVYGELEEQLLPWTYDWVKRDFSADTANKLKLYKKFVCVPSHTNFNQIINDCYNKYHKLIHKREKGNYDFTLKFLKHIFGEQIEIGLDYLKLLYEEPKQVLPILCIVSEERNTGKSTFLKWLKAIYDANAVYLEDDSFTSTHNSDWVQKLIIGVDEVKFSTRQEMDKLKRLSTSDKFMSRAMFSDKVEIDFFGKFILCSNHETTFINIDQAEIRFWVRKIQSLKDSEHYINIDEEKKTHESVYDLIDLLRFEIPAFLDFLFDRVYSAPKTTRMWFDPKELWTEQLELVKSASRPSIEKDAALLIYDAIIELDIHEIKFTAKDLHLMLKVCGAKYQLNQVKKLIEKSWSQQNSTNSSYMSVIMLSDNTFTTVHKKSGRYFSISKTYLEENYSEWLNVGNKQQTTMKE